MTCSERRREIDAWRAPALDLPRFAQYPESSRECALGEVNLIVAKNADFMARHRDPLITYGLDWLDRNVPALRRHGYLLASVGVKPRG